MVGAYRRVRDGGRTHRRAAPARCAASPAAADSRDAHAGPVTARTAGDERHALEGVLKRSFWRNLVAFILLMLLGELLVRLAFIA
jgi:hypothetical protein